MNTNALKRFAKEARLKLLSQVARKLEFVLTQDTAELRGKTKELSQLRQKIKDLGQAQVIEMVAYTWFNRLVALRFMDANGYTLPKVLTPLPGMTNPEILQNALGGTLDPDLTLDRQRLNDLLDGRTAAADARTEAYKLLLVAACNQWSKAMPFMFERISDYTELLLPDDLLSDFGIVADIRQGMSEEDCQQEEVIGWLYQFYISDENERLIKSKSVYQKHELAPASQLFTPKWVVKYMVDNTLGQVWAEMNPTTSILHELEFYIEPAYKSQLPSRSKKRLEDIKFFEPCVGSAHILSYAFDVFYLMYEEQGYNSYEIPELILKHNLFGVDIDERAAQIASFVMMMKGRRKYSRFFRKQITPNITFYQDFENDPKFNNVKALGSLVKVEPNEIDTLKVEEGSLFTERQEKLKKLYTFLGQRYDCVVTNPPYISSSRMEGSVKQYVEVNYPDTKSDLFATFIVRCLELCNEEGLTGYMTPFVWMFITTYQKLRTNIIDNHLINNLIQLEYSGFDGATVPICTFTLRNKPIQDAKGSYVRLSEFKGAENQGPKTLEAIQNPHCGWFYTANQKDFEKIPGSPIGYWASSSIISIFSEGKSLASLGKTGKGSDTGNNAKFIRRWYELQSKSIDFDCNSVEFTFNSDKKFYPTHKGGGYRKWAGNRIDVVNWQNDGEEIRKLQGSTIRNHKYYFKPCISWGKISSSKLSVRYIPIGSIADDAGPSAFLGNFNDIVLGYLNSCVSEKFISFISPTLNFQVGDISILPIAKYCELPTHNHLSLLQKLIYISQNDWDSYETSWDFTVHPFLVNRQSTSLLESYNFLRHKWQEVVTEMKNLEENNNRIFIEAYGLQDELKPDVPLNEITLTSNPHYRYGGNKSEEELETLLRTDTITDLLSYAVGCLFGRYSLDKEGLILANQGETLQDYFLHVFGNSTPPLGQSDGSAGGLFLPDEDNIIPVLEGEWFNDDIVGRFRAFLKAAFGEEHFDQNLRFIEDTLGKDIRKYFVKDFYNDHIKRYKKRPIYWMFSSPKGHFKALMYLHRYQPDLCSKLLNDYLQAFISKLEAAKHTQTMLSVREDISAREKIAANKEIDKLELMLKDCRDYERMLFLTATQKISMDLDDGVKVNYQKFKEVLVPIKGLEKEED